MHHTIRRGDVLVFEANRGDFVLQTYLSNGKTLKKANVLAGC
jgi:hypothetical protein